MTTDVQPSQSDTLAADANADGESGGNAGRGRARLSLAGAGRGALLAAALVAGAGMVLTTFGAFGHGGPLIAPGATLTLLGGAWLGNLLARRDVRLFPRGAHPGSSNARTD